MEESMKAIYGMILVVLLGSCSPFGLNPMGYEILHEDLDVAWKKVSSMKYMAEPVGSNYWKSPIEFFRDGGGDCEDFAVALMYLLGEDSKIAFMHTESPIAHAVVLFGAKCIDPQIYETYVEHSLIYEIWSYDIAMQKATKYGTKYLSSGL
jgi:hypothetical protein